MADIILAIVMMAAFVAFGAFVKMWINGLKGLADLERIASYVAVFLLVVPILLALKLLLFEDADIRAAFGIFGIAYYFCIGVVLKLGLRRLRTNRALGFRLIEVSFYLGSAGFLAAFVYMCSTNPFLFTSVSGVLFVLGNFVIMIICFFALKKTINEIKVQNLGDQTA